MRGVYLRQRQASFRLPAAAAIAQHRRSLYKRLNADKYDQEAGLAVRSAAGAIGWFGGGAMRAVECSALLCGAAMSGWVSQVTADEWRPYHLQRHL